MPWSATADVEKFDEAVAWFKSRFPVTQEIADALAAYSGDRAWTIAGVSQLDIVLQTYDELLKAIENGTPLEEFQDAVEESLTEAWGKTDSPRIELIFRNATQQSLNAGRWRQMTDPDVKDLRPYVKFDGIADARQSTICEELDGTIVHVDDAWLKTHSPALHHRCRSQLVSLSASDAERQGITDDPPATKADKGFGKPPTEAEWKPKASDYPDDLFAEYEQKRADLEENAERKKVAPDDDDAGE
ncbi:MAG TPA: phage minor head protein [Polyangiaceae bacterium]|nr:phage minor head protein [Polyangiaceae bacterium]